MIRFNVTVCFAFSWNNGTGEKARRAEQKQTKYAMGLVSRTKDAGKEAEDRVRVAFER